MNAPSLLLPAAGSVDPLACPPADLDAAVLGQLASIAVDSAPLGLVLQHLARIATRAIPGAAAVSITVVRDHTATSAGFTGAVAAALDERQYEAGFGPCLHAAATGGEVVVDDTTTSEACPAFAAVAVSNAASLDSERAACAQQGTAMASRAGIEQAKGMLMAQRGIDAQAAFAALSTTSQESNVKLA